MGQAINFPSSFLMGGFDPLSPGAILGGPWGIINRQEAALTSAPSLACIKPFAQSAAVLWLLIK